MSLWSWLTSSGQPPARFPIEPLLPAERAPIEQKQGSLVGSINSLAFPQPLLYAALGGYASNTGVPVTPLTALQSTAFWGCVKCISEDIAGLDVQIRRRLVTGGWKIDIFHPLNRLLRRPNQFQSKYQFWCYVLTSYCLRGNAFIVIQRDRAGNPVELIPVSPDRVTVRISPETGFLWYRVNSLHIGFGVMIAPEDMLHMKNISIDGYLGLSPVACAQDSIGLTLAAQQHGAILFRQGGQVSGVLKHPGRLSKEAGDNIAESWRDTHSGVQNAHKVAVLEEGMSFEKISMTSEDAQFLQTRQFQVADICRLFRVPPNKVGDYGRATFSNIEQQQLQYKDDCLEPHTDQLSDLMNNQLLFDDERDVYAVYFDYTTMMSGDRTQRYQGHQIGLLNGFLSRNEVRVMENMNPIPGGDEYRVPLNTGTPDANPLHPETAPQRIPPNESNGNGNGDGDQI